MKVTIDTNRLHILGLSPTEYVALLIIRDTVEANIVTELNKLFGGKTYAVLKQLDNKGAIEDDPFRK